MKDPQRDHINYYFKKLLLAEIAIGLVSCFSDICGIAVNGRFLSSSVLAAISLASFLESIMTFAGYGILRGSSVLYGRSMGTGNIDDIRSILVTSIFFMMLFGGLLVASVFVFPETVVMLSGGQAGSAGIEDAIAYFKGFVWSPVFLQFTKFLMMYLQINGKANTLVLTAVELAAGNLIFSLLNVFCFGGTAFGAGLGAACAQFIPLCHMIILCIRDGHFPQLRFKYFSTRILKETLLIGVPLGIIMLFVGIRNSLMNRILMEYGGLAAVSARAVYMPVIGFSDAFVAAVPAVAMIIASIYVGERNKDALVSLFRRSLKLTAIITLAVTAVMLAVAGPLCRLLCSDQAVALYAGRFLSISIFAAVFESIVVLILNYYIALDRRRYVNIFTIFHGVLLHILFSVVLSEFMGVYGVFASYPATEITCLIAIVIIAAIKNKRPVKHLSDVLSIDESMTVPPHASAVIQSRDDAAGAISMIRTFCEEHAVSKRTSYLSQLCCEEMIANILDHGFTKAPKLKGLIELYAAYDDGLKIVIRDNGPQFDPNAVKHLYYPEDPAKNIGIRMVSKLADEFIWQNVVGLNTLIIKINDDTGKAR